jgi:ERF superfamily
MMDHMNNINELIHVLPIDCLAISPQIDQFCLAFNKAQSEMGLIKKTDQGHRHKYASIDTVLEVVIPILNKHGINFHQVPLSKNEHGERLMTLLTHVSGQYISFGSIKILHNPDDIQSLGGGITYTRRYACVSVLGLGQEDDDGERQKNDYEEKKRMPITEKSLERLKDLIRNKGANPEGMNKLLRDILNDTRTTSIDKLTEAQFHFVVKKFFS